MVPRISIVVVRIPTIVVIIIRIAVIIIVIAVVVPVRVSIVIAVRARRLIRAAGDYCNRDGEDVATRPEYWPL